MKRDLRIAIQVELNRAHGPALLEGIAAKALEHADWQAAFRVWKNFVSAEF